MAKSLLKFSLKTNLVKSIISEVVSNFSKYYYAYGRLYAWPGGDVASSDVSESYEYELSTRNDLLFMKQIDANDVAPIIRRINWVSGYTFDMYDEYVNDIDVTGTITVQNNSAIVTGFSTNFFQEILIGNIITIAAVDYRVLAINSNTELVLTSNYTGISIITPIAITKKDSSFSGATSLETAEFYCVTDDYNVYKCLYNNNNSPSTSRPIGTSDQVITLEDGYKWKYMYTIPLSLRNKFMTLSTMPVVTALNTQFYSAGSIVSASIENPGKGYDPDLVTLEVDGDGVLEESPYILDSTAGGFSITSPGSGYVSLSLLFKDPDLPVVGAQRAAATCTIGDLSAGVSSGYSNLTYNSVAATAITGSFTRNIATGDAVKINGVKYIVLAKTVNPDNLNIISITIKGNITPANDTEIFLTGCITGINVTNPGYGYSKPFYSATQDAFATNIVVIGNIVSDQIGGTSTGQGFEFTIRSKKNQAIITPLVSVLGEIVGIQVQKPGIGYTYATVKINHNYPTENDIPLDFQEASIILNFGIGDIESAQSTVELNAIPGAIHAVRVVDGGYGYDSVPTVTITGDGVGATARAIRTNDSRISAIEILTEGTGYTTATAVLSGVNATENAILSVPIAPRGGHGSDAISELFCKSVVFTGTLSREKNQGLSPTNDYRQICIIKNPKVFNKNTSLRSATASACILVTGSKNQTNFDLIQKDMVMTYGYEGKSYRYRVVEKNANYSATQSALLLSYIDNFIPPSTATYGNSQSQISFVSTSLTLPEVNKLSGEMLTIDNRQRFSPSSQQIIVASNSLTF